MPEKTPQELLFPVPIDAPVIIPTGHTVKRACIQAWNDLYYASPLLSWTSSSSSSYSTEIFLSSCFKGVALPIFLLSPSDFNEEFFAASKSCRMMQKEEVEILIKNGFQLIPPPIIDPLNKQFQATTWGRGAVRTQSKTEKNKVDVILTLKNIELTGEDKLPAGKLGGEWKTGQNNTEREGAPVKGEGGKAIKNGGLQGGGAGGGGNGGEEPNRATIVLDRALCFICQKDPYEFRAYCGHEFRVCNRCIGGLRGCPRCRQPLARRVRFNLHPRRQEANHTPPLIPAPQIPLPPAAMHVAPLYPPPLLVPEHEHPPNVGGLKIRTEEHLIIYEYKLPNGVVLSYPYLL